MTFLYLCEINIDILIIRPLTILLLTTLEQENLVKQQSIKLIFDSKYVYSMLTIQKYKYFGF